MLLATYLLPERGTQQVVAHKNNMGARAYNLHASSFVVLPQRKIRLPASSLLACAVWAHITQATTKNTLQGFTYYYEAANRYIL